MARRNPFFFAIVVTILFVVCYGSALIAQTPLGVDDFIASAHYGRFKKRHGKPFGEDAEEGRRFNAFKQNMQTAYFLNAHNPHAHYDVSGKFADLTPQEFAKLYLNPNYYARHGKDYKEHVHVDDSVRSGVMSVDWREKGVVTPVKNQGMCGSCWAFATTGNIEGQWALKNHSLVSLSEQVLVSCDNIDDGCNGGLMEQAMQWIINDHNGTVPTEDSYPYTSAGGTRPPCHDNGTVGAKIAGYMSLPHDEEEIAAYVGKNGPVAVAVDATTWQLYFGGVVTLCFGLSLNHGVLVVGFNRQAKPPYWIVKNSWGSSWGEKGYIRLAMGSNQCLLKNYAVTATIDDSNTSHVPTTAA
ncbi:cysteine peptidase A (CPA) [Leishmania donovani]|uniref:Cysteine peptidase A (CBA) n=1 Tax=Leishmania donovani TaxID=5661 RepID=Q9BIE1_LEIDO|nr:cysteine peptidase A (CBA) [Leishmania donovani]AAK27384.1 cysteine proteinase-like protein [Leishmania donovani]AYU78252.1 cysteine peptidase A (CPA) [Leishmania donovani]CAJ1988268.1 cysteine peptidase A (CPA) [Leishmania donovani]CBZ33611.1 cysteine peptidase A (CBA) [Leishmania donovani]VDZ44154.1 cysteine_peptidase_A_(CPA)/GeneDB:LmjF.19.1420 [Leishmania donovani]